MINQIFNSKDKPWDEQKVGRSKYIVGPEIAKNCSLRLFSLSPGEHFKGHEHNYIQIMYFTSGKGSVSLDDQVLQIKPGLTVVVLPNQCHSVKNSGNSNLEIFVFESYQLNTDDTPFIDF